jgi:phosphate starvation-inducible PhoH-like protein
MSSYKHRLDVEPKTRGQAGYVASIKQNIITLCLGPAGCGKTFLACWYAAKQLSENKIKKIIITRPLICCGKDIGAVPGDENEKASPYMRPVMDAFHEFFEHADLKAHINTGHIEFFPLELMRGSTLSNCVIILDEGQNADWDQIKMLLTRFGQNSKLILSGDASQSDIHGNWINNPLLEVKRRFEQDIHPNVEIVQLGRQDIVRHELIKWVLDRLDTDYNPNDPSTLPPPIESDENDFGFNPNEEYLTQ